MYLTLIYIYVLYFSASFKITYSKFLVFKIKANFLNQKIQYQQLIPNPKIF